MGKGKLALVLHAHLPYVRSIEPGSLEEDWFFQALMECYLPLIETLEKAKNEKDQSPKITISISPTLLSLLNDKVLKNRFPSWVDTRIQILKDSPYNKTFASINLQESIKRQLDNWKKYEGNLIRRFQSLERSEVIDILTCAATHGYLPLLRENPETVKGQLKTAIKEHFRLLGIKPLGIWLPECAYYENLDEIMQEVGLRYAVLDGHGLLHASPRPRYGLYAPICSKNGIAFFGRDSDSTLPVWSAKEGYPGAAEYREFHRDLGWDLPLEKLTKYGIKDARPLGLKLHKITAQNIRLENKELYDQDMASGLVKKHAKNYLQGRKIQLDLLEEKMEISPLLVAPFDAELFGHWWFEGPKFLFELFKQAKKEKVEFTRLKDVLQKTQTLQLCNPSPSSWGQGGYHHYWLNESNAWIVPEWTKAGTAMVKHSNKVRSNTFENKLLKQAARELLLAQSSDWSFILRAGTTTELAKERIHRHLNRFWSLINCLEGKDKISTDFLSKVENEDYIFPAIETKDWNSYKNDSNLY